MVSSALPSTPRASRRRHRAISRRSRRLSIVYLLPATIFLLAFCVYPLGDLVRMSVSSVHGADLLRRVWEVTGLANFQEAVASPTFAMAVVNTLLLVVINVTITTAGGLGAAFILQRDTKANGLIQAVMVFLWALPPLVTASVWKFLLSGDGLVPGILALLPGIDERKALLVDPDWALLAVGVSISWTGVAFASLVMRAGLLGIDRYQVEAASIDGASRGQLVRYIFLPSLRPSILVQALLAMLYSFRIIDYPFIMTGGGPGGSTTTLPLLAYKQSFGSLQFGTGAATAVITTLFVILLSLIYLWMIRQEEAE